MMNAKSLLLTWLLAVQPWLPASWTQVLSHSREQTQKVLMQKNPWEHQKQSPTKQLTTKEVWTPLRHKKNIHHKQIKQQISRKNCIVEDVPINVYAHPPSMIQNFEFKTEASYFMLNYVSKWITHPVGMGEIISHPDWTYTINYLTNRKVNGKEWWWYGEIGKIFDWRTIHLPEFFGEQLKTLFPSGQQESQYSKQPTATEKWYDRHDDRTRDTNHFVNKRQGKKYIQTQLRNNFAVRR